MLDEPGLAVAREPARPSVQPPGARVGELLAHVVQLPVELGHRPAQAFCGVRGRRDLSPTGVRRAQEALAQRDDEQLLVRCHRHPTHRRLRGGVLGLELGGRLDRHERGVVDEDVEVVRRRTGGEPHRERLEGQRDARPRAEPRLEQPLLVGDRRAEGRADVGQPPQPVLVVHLEEDPVQVRVVVDLDVGDPADGQRPVLGSDELLAAVLDGHAHGVPLTSGPVIRPSRIGWPRTGSGSPTCARPRPGRRPSSRRRPSP